MTALICLLVIVAVAVSAATVTITRSTLFAPLREKAVQTNRFLGKLVGCPYCMSHWVAALFVLPLHLMLGVSLLWLPVTSFGVIGLASFVTKGLVWATTLPPLARDNDAALRSALLQAQQTLLDQQREIQALKEQTIVIELADDDGNFWPPGASS